MKDTKYIVDSEGERVSVIVSNRDSESVEKFLREQLALSVLDLSIKYLDVSQKIKGEKKYATLLCRILAQIYLEQVKIKDDDKSYKVTKTQPEIAESFDIDKKNIQTQCNDILEPYMLGDRGRAVIDFQQHNPTTGLGATYTLNFLKVIDNAIGEFIEKSNIRIYELIEIINNAKNYHFPNKELKDVLYKSLDEISNEIVYEKSSSAKGSRKWQNSK